MAFDGSASSFGQFIGQLLPTGWLFPDENPVDAAIVAALAANPASTWALLQGVSQQSRLASASGTFLDLAAQDLFGPGQFMRRTGEGDDLFRQRIMAEQFRPRVTRAALVAALTDLTGYAPTIIEPTDPADTLGYGYGGYGLASRYATRTQVCQVFVTVYNPPQFVGTSPPGYGSGGYSVCGGYNAPATSVVSDDEIYSTIMRTIPAGITCWTVIVPGNPLNEVPESLASGQYDFTSINSTALLPSLL